jgi:hypothetical protein
MQTVKTCTAAARTWVRSAAAGVVVAAALAACGTEPEQLLALEISGGDTFYGNELRLDAIGIYSDNQWKYVTQEADWVSSATTVAMIEMPDFVREPVTVTAVGPGQVVITATHGGLTASKTLTVP